MRVCLVAHRFYHDNAHMMQFAKALAKRGDEVDVICLRRSGLPTYEVMDGVHVFRVQGRTVDETRPIAYLIKILTFLVRSAATITVRHLRKPYDLIHVQSVPDFLVFAAAFPKALGAKVILDLRDLVPELYASKFGVRAGSVVFKLLLGVERASAALADHVIVANPIWYERVVGRSARRSKCTMFWYYPDPEVFYPRPKRKSDGKLLIVYPGTLNWHQGLDIAIRAFPQVLERVPCAEFRIYGEGPARPRLAALIKELGLEGRVKLLSPMPLLKIAEVMAASDLALVPKRVNSGFGDEAASTKIPEFLALGIPVVASRTKVEMCFFDDSIVRYFKSEDEEDLASAVAAVCREPDLKQRLIANGIGYTGRTSWDAGMAKYRALVDALVRGVI
jgi:glycosyltransferase involved in cell wall biosynthesis